jgi:hypothetical protein
MFGKYPILNVFTPYALVCSWANANNELFDVRVVDNNIIIVTIVGITAINFRCLFAIIGPFISLILSIWKLYMIPVKYAISVN